MPSDDSAASGAASSAPSADDWAAHLTSRVDDAVSLVRDRTLGPVATAVRFAILGLVAAAVGTFVAVLFAVGIVRVLDTEVFHRRVWASYLVIGGIFCAGGLLLTRMRRHR